jgi:hypothetical protein
VKEEGCSLETIDTENTLLDTLVATDAVVWSPQTDSESVLALSMMVLAQSGNSFDFLHDEPDLYTLADGEPV